MDLERKLLDELAAAQIQLAKCERKVSDLLSLLLKHANHLTAVEHEWASKEFTGLDGVSDSSIIAEKFLYRVLPGGWGRYVDGQVVRIIDGATEKRTIVCGLSITQIEALIEEHFGQNILVSGPNNMQAALGSLAETCFSMQHDLDTDLDYMTRPQDLLFVYDEIRTAVCLRIRSIHARILSLRVPEGVLSTDLPAHYNNVGTQYQQDGCFLEAIEFYKRAIELKPGFAEAHTNRGGVYFRLERFPEAIADLSIAIESNARLMGAFNIRWQCYIKLKDPERALADIDEVISLRGNARDHNNRASILNELHRFSDAKIAADRAVSIDPAYIFNRGIIKLNGNFLDESIDDFTIVIQQNPQSVNALSERGRAYLLAGKYPEAANDYGEIVKIMPNDPRSYYCRGMAYDAAGEATLALQDLDKAITMNHVFIEAHRLRADIHNHEGKYQEAVDGYSAAIKLNHKDAMTQNNFGRCLADQREFEKGLLRVIKAIQLDPSVGLFYSNRGQIYFELQKFDQCIADCLEAIEKCCNGPEPWYYKAKAHQAKSENDQALLSFEHFVEKVSAQKIREKNLGVLLLDSQTQIALLKNNSMD